MTHKWHKPYVSTATTVAVKKFIEEHLQSTPQQIFQDIQKESNLQVGAPETHVTQAQVHYWWSKMCSSKWNSDKDPFVSASNLLETHNRFSPFQFEGPAIKAFGFYIEDAIVQLCDLVTELSMDATYGTNNEGADLFAVLAEYGGTGMPLAYVFIKRTSESANFPGQLTAVLHLFLAGLRDRRVDPVFVGSDKDFAQINAIQQTWPRTTIQLCFWHVRRALRARFTDSAKTATSSYRPYDAYKFVPEIEICWASVPGSRPEGDHKDGKCSCPSKGRSFSERTRIELSAPESQLMLDMISRHFNAHASIPSASGRFFTPAEIYQQALREAYRFCRDRDYPRLWAYLFVNWYQEIRWPLWARSSHPTMIPVLKTTMIMESHWRLLKHDFLHHFARPRIDRVTFVLLQQVIPRSLARLTALRTGKDEERLQVGEQHSKRSGRNWSGERRNQPFRTHWVSFSRLLDIKLRIFRTLYNVSYQLDVRMLLVFRKPLSHLQASGRLL